MNTGKGKCQCFSYNAVLSSFEEVESRTCASASGFRGSPFNHEGKVYDHVLPHSTPAINCVSGGFR